MNHVAFTGTQKGMTNAQLKSFISLINHIDVDFFHHGDCVGADADAHRAVVDTIPVIIHPCTIESKRAWCTGADGTHLPLPPLERNRVMVDMSGLLIATPKEYTEQLRSGTWATIRYAYKKNKKIRIIWPDGRIEACPFIPSLHRDRRSVRAVERIEPVDPEEG